MCLILQFKCNKKETAHRALLYNGVCDNTNKERDYYELSQTSYTT